MGRVAHHDPPLAHCENLVMPTASSHAPNSRKGPGGTPALMRAGKSWAERCSRTDRAASTTTALCLSLRSAPMPLPIPRAAAGSGGSEGAASASDGRERAGGRSGT
eukprot:621657-Alexandrium_andersonii.AAC.1